jgi:hypothetical protein
MNNYLTKCNFPTLLNLCSIILSVLIFSTSCSKFVNLGDSSESYYEDDFPEDLTESGDKGKEEDSGESEYPGDYGNSGDSGDYGNSGDGYYDDEAEEASDEDHAVPDVDKEPEWPYENPFPDDFNNDKCDCGNNPNYNPVCCINDKGVISVFNACFANCYFLFSDGKICSSYDSGICDSIPEHQIDNDDDFQEDSDDFYDEDRVDTDYLTDLDETFEDGDDSEFNDSDSDLFFENEYVVDDEYFDDETINDDDDVLKPDNECGCYPDDTDFLCCYKNGTVLISRCLADCHCNGAYLPCFVD